MKSHYVVCTDNSHCEINGGIQNLVALVCFCFSFAFFLSCLLLWIRCIYYDETAFHHHAMFCFWFFCFFNFSLFFILKLSWLQNVDGFSGAKRN